MKTFLAILNSIPAIILTVQTVETAIPLPKAGRQKMDLVLGAAGTAWEVGQIGQQINKANWLTAVQAITNVTVAGLNAAGVFGSNATAPAATGK